VDDVKFGVRKSELERFAERIGLRPEELAAALKAEVVKTGSGFRYVISMRNFLYFVVARLYDCLGERRWSAREISLEEFELALTEALSELAGASGYAKLAEVMDLVARRLGIGEGEFSRKLQELLQARRGHYVLLEGGDVKVRVGSKKYGYIKRVSGTA
jgi:hypothetical protein